MVGAGGDGRGGAAVSADAGLTQPLVWIDLEMTGLDPDAEVIVEIAAIITDGELATVVEGPDIVVAAPGAALAGMVPKVQQMHAKSGLDVAVRASTTSVADAERQVLDFVRGLVPQPGTAPLAGNSVHADRMFLRRHMSALEAHVHYRNVDVSTLKELARRWHPDVLAAAPRKTGDHRALADIRESIAELRYYRDALFRPT